MIYHEKQSKYATLGTRTGRSFGNPEAFQRQRSSFELTRGVPGLGGHEDLRRTVSGSKDSSSIIDSLRQETESKGRQIEDLKRKLTQVINFLQM